MGPDAVLLRIPADGGLARAHRVGSDSTLWLSRVRTPAIARVLGFDEFLGLLLAQDRADQVLALDLRLGTLDTLSQERLRGHVVSEGGAAYGLDGRGRVLRVTPAATWNWPPPGGASALIPNPDGSLLVLADSGPATVIRRLIPPESKITDSATVARVRLTARTQAGDRLWAVTDEGLLSLRARDLEQAFTLTLRDSVAAIVLTPSGDRLFVATGEDRLRVVDRYAERERGSIDLPAPVSALRMDPDGHYLLARARESDSVYVISIGTNRVVSTVATAWRQDLPLVTPDGRILIARGADAVLLDAESLRERQTYRGGASDEWSLVRWNGFRPRAAGLDRPVEFEEFAADSARADSAVAAMIAARYGDLTGIARATPDEPPMEAPTPAQRPEGEMRGTWTVSFATLLTEERARAMADSITVGGRRARVVPGNRDGVPVWRVLLGPFNSRQDAERAGMSSRLSYWVFEGTP
jgi:YVTN family beta-propeller protein